MAVFVFVNFNGNCREAVEYYAEIFETKKPEFMTYGEFPADPNFIISEESKKLIMYTSLDIDGSNVMFSDTLPGMKFLEGNNINLTVSNKDIDEIKKLFNKLKVEGTVEMELQETFWSKCYGMLIDKFGIPWQFNHDSGMM
ncbi:MAG: VOC family protein [Sebaldella sp.]|nr:VOC family protein [Sebaldella sp.]